MSPLRLSRWTALLVLPLLTGALLLMHGLDADAAPDAVHASSVVAPAHHGDTPLEHHEGGCDGCAGGHIMAACVAVVVTIVGLRATRHTARTRWPMLLEVAAGPRGAAHQALRPPDPAWIRLAVMRC